MLKMRNLVMAVVAAVLLVIPAAAQPPHGIIPVMMQVDRYAEILSITPAEIELVLGAGDTYSGTTRVVFACNYPITFQALIEESPAHNLGAFELSLNGGPWVGEGVAATMPFDVTPPGGTGIDIFVQVNNPDLLLLTFDGRHRVATVYVDLVAR